MKNLTLVFFKKNWKLPKITLILSTYSLVGSIAVSALRNSTRALRRKVDFLGNNNGSGTAELFYCQESWRMYKNISCTTKSGEFEYLKKRLYFCYSRVILFGLFFLLSSN